MSDETPASANVRNPQSPAPIAAYAPIGLDVWVALDNDSDDYDEWLDRLGWADLWAHLIAEVHRLSQPSQTVPNRAPWHQRRVQPSDPEQGCGLSYDHEEEWDDDRTTWTCRRCGAEGWAD